MGFATGTKWLYATIPYVVDPGFSPSAAQEIERALDEWRIKTGLIFVPRTSETNFLRFKLVPGPGAPSQGCFSAVGMQGGEQTLGCGDPVYAGWLGVAHEIGHAIGLVHEHQRPDRDQHITMAETTDHNLAIDNAATPIGNYDCVSLMHYDAYAKEISAKPGGCPTWGSTTGLSTGDVAAVRQWYGIRGGVVGQATAGAVSEIAVVTLTDTNRLVTPVRDGSGDLKLIVWDVDDNGNPTRKGDASAGAVSGIAVETLSPSRFATAVRTGGGGLGLEGLGAIPGVEPEPGDFKIIVWDVDDNGNVTRKGDGSAGAVGLLAVTDLFKHGGPWTGENRLFSAVRDAGGNLKVIVWDVDKDGNVTRTGDASAGAVGAIAVGSYGPGAAVTFVRTGSGQLKIILWYVQDGKVVRGADHTAYAVQEVAALNPFISVARDGVNQLRVSFWQVTAGGGEGSGIINLQGGYQGGDVTRVAVAPLQKAPSAQATAVELPRWATASRDWQGNLSILVWQQEVSLIH